MTSRNSTKKNFQLSMKRCSTSIIKKNTNLNPKDISLNNKHNGQQFFKNLIISIHRNIFVKCVHMYNNNKQLKNTIHIIYQQQNE